MQVYQYSKTADNVHSTNNGCKGAGELIMLEGRIS